jgi:hypothetical protein
MLGYGTAEQQGILRDQSDLTAQAGQADFADIVSIDADALQGSVSASASARACFSGSVGSSQRDGFSGTQVEARQLPFGIGKIYALKPINLEFCQSSLPSSTARAARQKFHSLADPAPTGLARTLRKPDTG